MYKAVLFLSPLLQIQAVKPVVDTSAPPTYRHLQLKLKKLKVQCCLSSLKAVLSKCTWNCVCDSDLTAISHNQENISELKITSSVHASQKPLRNNLNLWVSKVARYFIKQDISPRHQWVWNSKTNRAIMNQM